jgi:hypothetical protein
MEIISKDPFTAGKNALTLVALFEDRELNTLPNMRGAGQTLSKRVEWILDLTRGSSEGEILDAVTQLGRLPLQFRFDALFGDNDCWFKEDLRDNQFYQSKWTKRQKYSNQVGHFLTAVALGYSFLDTSSDKHLAENLAIGHELRSDYAGDPDGGLPAQLKPGLVTDQMRKDFWDAVDADERGAKLKRDELLWGILGFSGSVNPNYVDPNREGNSLQDLRLTVKGIRFGKWVKDNPGLQPIDGARWLRRNIVFGVSRRP